VHFRQLNLLQQLLKKCSRLLVVATDLGLLDKLVDFNNIVTPMLFGLAEAADERMASLIFADEN
jgi:hypothetical protein